jgi:hypothetical protein
LRLSTEAAMLGRILLAALVVTLGGDVAAAEPLLACAGKSCEKPRGDPCAPNPCLNGGVCKGAADGFSCACAGTWSGKICEMRCGRSQLIAYRLEGRFKLMGTALGATDGDWPLPGTEARSGGAPVVVTSEPNLVLRVLEDGRRAAIVSFDLPQNVYQSTAGTDAYTNVLHSVPRNVCGAATGTLEGTTLTWDPCATPATHGTKSWTPSELATGPGCLANFGDVGNIWCGGWACLLGGLKFGDNPVRRPPAWNLALSPFRFDSSELKSFSADWFDMPNDRKSARSQLAITVATELSRTSEVTPDCACR